MRPARILAGISLFGASAWLTPLVSDYLGTSEIFGFVTVGGILAFVAGVLFYSGVKAE